MPVPLLFSKFANIRHLFSTPLFSKVSLKQRPKKQTTLPAKKGVE